jgi:transcription antitermination factor NusG
MGKRCFTQMAVAWRNASETTRPAKFKFQMIGNRFRRSTE